MMPFWLAMAGRELRSAWRHFVYFLACIALGVGAVVGVSLFSVNVEQAVLKEARGLLGGDLEVRVSRPLGTSGTDLLRGLESRGVHRTKVSELVAMASIGQPSPGGTAATSQLVELKAVEPSYPLYGVLKLDRDQPLAELLRRDAEGCPDLCLGAGFRV